MDSGKGYIKDYNTVAATALELAFNNAYSFIWSMRNWWFARRTCYFNTVAVYNTGTVSITQYSQTLTGVNTVWTSKMVGRKVVVGLDGQGYAVKSVEGTLSLTLEEPYQGATQTSATYAMYKHVYLLDSRAMRVLFATNNLSCKKVYSYNERKFTLYGENSNSHGSPLCYIPRGQTTEPYYNTGTVTATNGSDTITGSGTAWDSDMIGMVMKMAGDEIEYTVKAVSAVSIQINKVYDGTSVSDCKYEIGPKGTEQVEIWPAPDVAYSFKYRCQLRILKLISDNDVPELPEQWHPAILWMGLAEALPGKARSNVDLEPVNSQAAKWMQNIANYHDVNEDENPNFEENDKNIGGDDNAFWRWFPLNG